MNTAVCCHEYKAYKPGSMIMSTRAEDGCTELQMMCTKSGTRASVVFSQQRLCTEPASQTQVESQMQLLVEKLDNLEMVMKGQMATMTSLIQGTVEQQMQVMISAMLEKMAGAANLVENFLSIIGTNGMEQMMQTEPSPPMRNGAPFKI